MTTMTHTPARGTGVSWLQRAENWLDDKGKGAWIAAMVLGFIFFWPVGLAFLAYMIWSKRMFNGKSCSSRRTRQHVSTRSTGNKNRLAFHRSVGEDGAICGHRRDAETRAGLK